jgi:hypothetical protein
MGPSCPMWGTISFQTNVSIGIMLFIIVSGLYLIFWSKEEKIITKVKTFKPQLEPKKITKQNYQKVLKTLTGDEKKILEKVISWRR